MRPYNGYYEDYDDIEELAYDRSKALQKLLDDCRREERQHNRHRSFDKDRHHRDPFDWDDDDDWDSYLDESSSEYCEDLNSHY